MVDCSLTKKTKRLALRFRRKHRCVHSTLKTMKSREQEEGKMGEFESSKMARFRSTRRFEMYPRTALLAAIAEFLLAEFSNEGKANQPTAGASRPNHAGAA